MTAWNVPVIAHEETARVLNRLAGLSGSDEELERLVQEGTISEGSAEHIRLEYGSPRVITVCPPDLIFSGSITVDLGGVTCKLNHVGGDHSADSCVLHVIEDKVLFLGDALGPSVYGGPRRYSSTGFLKLLGLISGYKAHVLVESHGVPMTDQEFRADIASWERLARIVDVFGDNRERVLLELKAYLQLEELPSGLLRSVEYFLEGAR